MTWGNIISGTIVLLLISAAIFSIRRSKKQGGCCGCDGGCRNKEHCKKN